MNTIYNLQTEWGKYHDGAYIPGGALFINNSSYAAHKDAIDAFLAKIDANVVDAIDDVDKVAAALNSYEEATEGEDSVKTRFGIPNANIYKAIQSGGKNGFGLYKDNDLAARKAIANSFAEAIGGTAFADSAFLS